MTLEQVKEFGFGHPWWLLLLPLLWWLFWRKGNTGFGPAITHSSTGLLIDLVKKRTGGPGRILKYLRLFALTILVLAMARPRVPTGEVNDPNKGIDIMLVCDASNSMDTPDFTLGTKKITRREALLMAISSFVDGRKNDRIGMVGFAKNVYLLSPMTTDGNWIKSVYKMVELKGGTAVGDGIYAGVNKLEENKSRSKVIIFVTDGLSNAGTNPMDAGEYAKQKGVRIYAVIIKDIQLSTKFKSVTDNAWSQIASKTGGQFFQASDTGALVQIYRQIDRMEKHEFDTNRYTLFKEFFPWLVAFAGVILLFEWIASHTFWMRLP